MFLKDWFVDAFSFGQTWPHYWKYESTGNFLKFLLRSLFIMIPIVIIVAIILLELLNGFIEPKLAQKVSAPTAHPVTHATETTVVIHTPTPPPSNMFVFGSWNQTEWTTTFDETQQLTAEANVINLAACKDGECHFSKLYSVLWTTTWLAANANPDVTNITQAVSPTGFSYQDKNFNRYVLNMYEPFIVDTQPGKIFMVDQNGDLWYQPYSNSLLVPLKRVQNERIPVDIQPNPELTGIKQ